MNTSIADMVKVTDTLDLGFRSMPDTHGMVRWLGQCWTAGVV